MIRISKAIADWLLPEGCHAATAHILAILCMIIGKAHIISGDTLSTLDTSFMTYALLTTC